MGKLSGRARLYDSSSHIEDKRRNCETKKRKRGINVTSLRLPRQSAGFGRGREKFYDQLQRRTERRKARRGRAIKLARQNTAGARRRRRPASQPTSINGTHLSVSVFDHWNRYFSWGTGSAGGRMAAAAGGDREHLGRDGRQTRHCRGGRNMNLFKGKLELVALIESGAHLAWVTVKIRGIWRHRGAGECSTASSPLEFTAPVFPSGLLSKPRCHYIIKAVKCIATNSEKKNTLVIRIKRVLNPIFFQSLSVLLLCRPVSRPPPVGVRDARRVVLPLSCVCSLHSDSSLPDHFALSRSPGKQFVNQLCNGCPPRLPLQSIVIHILPGNGRPSLPPPYRKGQKL